MEILRGKNLPEASLGRGMQVPTAIEEGYGQLSLQDGQKKELQRSQVAQCVGLQETPARILASLATL